MREYVYGNRMEELHTRRRTSIGGVLQCENERLMAHTSNLCCTAMYVDETQNKQTDFNFIAFHLYGPPPHMYTN